MTIFIALLRGINVGGKNRIKMANLKSLFETIGLLHVETYIQSGNVIFESDQQEELLQEKIEHEIENKFGFMVNVVIRTADELDKLIKDCPFSVEEVMEAESLNSEGESLYASMFTQALSQEKIEYLSTFRSEKDEFRIKNRDIYLLVCHSIRNSKVANHLQKLDIPSTVRNWKTITKLQELVKSRT